MALCHTWKDQTSRKGGFKLSRHHWGWFARQSWTWRFLQILPLAGALAWFPPSPLPSPNSTSGFQNSPQSGPEYLGTSWSLSIPITPTSADCSLSFVTSVSCVTLGKIHLSSIPSISQSPNPQCEGTRLTAVPFIHAPVQSTSSHVTLPIVPWSGKDRDYPSFQVRTSVEVLLSSK